jgi:tRNA 2-selenouridine synthase
MEKYKGMETKECPCVTFEEVLSFCRTDGTTIIIDTRTPKEFTESHVIDAVNIPLLNDQQRHIIGKTYKEESREAAMAIGKEIFGPATAIHDFLRQFEQYKTKRVFVYCWRGGMRSRIVVNLLVMHGFDVFQVSRGFKEYMNEIIWKGLDAFASSFRPRFIVLFGNTGTRKTEILKKLEAEGLPVMDLEGLAGHKGSVYGGVNSVQKSQKMFSILVYHTLESFKDSKYIFVEGEGVKIGNIHVPEFICDKIKQDDWKVLVAASLETRVKVIRKEYVTTEDSIRQLHEATDTVSMVRHLGKKNVAMLHSMAEAGQYDACTEWLLLNHYDLRYQFAKDGHSYKLDVRSDDIDECCAELTDFYHSLLNEGENE